MAYRLDGANDNVKSSIGGLDGLGQRGAYSVAAVIKRNATGAWHAILAIDTSGGGVRHDSLEFNPSNQLAFWTGVSADGTGVSSTTITSTSTWYIIVITWGGPGEQPRFHIFDGSTWVHEDGSGYSQSGASPVNFASTDVIVVGETGGADDIAADIAAVGFIGAELTDLQVETLTIADGLASFQDLFTGTDAWLQEFGSASSRTDLTGNGGNETSRSGTTLVADPPGWVPQPNVILARPAAAPGINVTSGATAWGFGSWVEILSGHPFDVALNAVDVLQHVGGTTTPALDTTHELLLELGTGAAGSETTQVQIPFAWRMDDRTTHVNPVIENPIFLPEPFVIPAGTRVAVRVADSVAAALQHDLANIWFREIPEAAGATYEKAGALIVGALLAGVSLEGVESARAGALTASSQLAGADSFTASEAGALIAGPLASGPSAQEAGARSGSLAAGALSAALDVFEAVETGALTPAAFGSGERSHEQPAAGALIAGALLSALRSFEAAEAGALLAAAQSGGDSAREGSEAGSLLAGSRAAGLGVKEQAGKAGFLLAGSILAALRQAEKPRSGSIVAGSALSAQDQATFAEAGSLMAGTFAGGARSLEATRAGALLAAALLAGVKIAGGVDTPIVVPFDPPSPDPITSGSSPAGTHFDLPSPASAAFGSSPAGGHFDRPTIDQE